MPYVVTLCELTQGRRQLRSKNCLKDSAGFGPEGEALRSASEREVPQRFLRLNFSPPYPRARNAGQGATIPGV